MHVARHIAETGLLDRMADIASDRFRYEKGRSVGVLSDKKYVAGFEIYTPTH